MRLKSPRAFHCVLGLMGIAVSYVALHQSGLVSKEIIGPPATILNALAMMISEGTLFRDAAQSLWRVAVGVLIGVASGWIISSILHLQRRSIREALTAALDFLRVISPLAWAPVMLALFGLGDGAAISLVAIASLFPATAIAAEALGTLPRAAIDTGRNFGYGVYDRTRLVLLPLLVGRILSSVRVSFGIGWYVVIAAEMLGAQGGLGYSIALGRLMLDFPSIFAIVLVIGVIGFLIGTAIEKIGELSSPWEKAR